MRLPKPINSYVRFADDVAEVLFATFPMFNQHIFPLKLLDYMCGRDYQFGPVHKQIWRLAQPPDRYIPSIARYNIPPLKKHYQGVICLDYITETNYREVVPEIKEFINPDLEKSFVFLVINKVNDLAKVEDLYSEIKQMYYEIQNCRVIMHCRKKTG